MFKLDGGRGCMVDQHINFVGGRNGRILYAFRIDVVLSGQPQLIFLRTKQCLNWYYLVYYSLMHEDDSLSLGKDDAAYAYVSI